MNPDKCVRNKWYNTNMSFPNYEEFFELLEEVCAELPDEMFSELHHGISLEEECKYSPYAVNGDLIIMGEYSHQNYGNEIRIYYGSFEARCRNQSIDAIKRTLRDVVRHEFRHHLEHLGGVTGADSLEREDEIQIEQYKRGRR